jgi:hypothetical protein
MKPSELFNKLEDTGNHYSYFKKSKKYVNIKRIKKVDKKC